MHLHELPECLSRLCYKKQEDVVDHRIGVIGVNSKDVEHKALEVREEVCPPLILEDPRMVEGEIAEDWVEAKEVVAWDLLGRSLGVIIVIFGSFVILVNLVILVSLVIFCIFGGDWASSKDVLELILEVVVNVITVD